MHFARLAGFEHQPDPAPRAPADKVVVQAGRRQQRWNGRVLPVHALIGKDQHGGAAVDGLVRSLTEILQRRFQAGRPVLRLERNGQGHGGKSALPAAAQRLQFTVSEEGDLQANLPAAFRFRAQKVAFRAECKRGGGNQLFTNRVQRRIGDLGEKLLEVVVEELRLVGKHGQRRVGAHGAHRLNLVHGHGADVDPQVLEAVAERLLSLQSAGVVV